MCLQHCVARHEWLSFYKTGEHLDEHGTTVVSIKTFQVAIKCTSKK